MQLLLVTSTYSSVIGPALIIYAAATGTKRMLRGRMCARTREATAEPAAGACGMRYPVESNGTFMETASSSQSTWFIVDTLKFACAAFLFLIQPQRKGFI